MSARSCAGCGHEVDEHTSEGCSNGWVWDSIEDAWDTDLSMELGACGCSKDREGRG